MKTLRICTRGSQLALWQANAVKSAIESAFADIQCEIKTFKTKGDKILDVALSKIGDKGLFTKEIEEALLQNEGDIAVHSLKDLPTSLPEGLILAAVLPRADVRDAWVSREGKMFSQLNGNETIATSSLRRRAALMSINAAFNIVDIRGNVETRLRKMQEGYCDGMIMASAGLIRLGFGHLITEKIDIQTIVPAVGQGAVAIETRQNDAWANSVVAAINHSPTLTAVAAERVFMQTMEGGCQIPLGCHAQINDNNATLTAFVASPDGKQRLQQSVTGSAQSANNLALQLAQALIAQGADKILQNIRL